MVDKTTNQHRGFGFITLKDPPKVLDVLTTQPHFINSKQIDCKIAIPKDLLNAVDNASTTNTDTTSQDVSSSSKSTRNTNNSNKSHHKAKKHINTTDNTITCVNTQYTSKTAFTGDKQDTPLHLRKMFIGGLPTGVSIDALVDYFGKFGPIEKGIIMTDKNTGRLRGFGFIIFANQTTLNTVLNAGQYHFVCGKWIECKRAQPKDQVKHTANTELTLFSNEELFVYKHKQQQQQSMMHNDTNSSNSSSNNDIIDMKGQSFENYFNNCILNPFGNNNYSHRSMLLDSNDGDDVSELKLYKNAHKTKLFPEEMDNAYAYPLTTTFKHDICNSNNNSSDDIIIDFKDLFGPNKDTMHSKQSSVNENFKPY